MKVRQEIEKYSLPEERHILRWLFDRYHTEREWAQMARCVFVRYGDQQYQSHRCWRPSPEGRKLFHYETMLKALRFYAAPFNWAEVDTEAGKLPGEAADYGQRAREVLSEMEWSAPDPVSDWVFDKEKRRYVKTT